MADVWVDDTSKPGGGSTRRCRYVPAATTIAGGAGKEVLIGGVPHVLYSRHCDGEHLGMVWLANVTPDDVLRYAHQEVRRKVPNPEPVLIWPDPDYDWAYTQVPLDFRASRSSYPSGSKFLFARGSVVNAVEQELERAVGLGTVGDLRSKKKQLAFAHVGLEDGHPTSK